MIRFAQSELLRKQLGIRPEGLSVKSVNSDLPLDLVRSISDTAEKDPDFLDPEYCYQLAVTPFLQPRTRLHGTSSFNCPPITVSFPFGDIAELYLAFFTSIDKILDWNVKNFSGQQIAPSQKFHLEIVFGYEMLLMPLDPPEQKQSKYSGVIIDPDVGPMVKISKKLSRIVLSKIFPGINEIS